MSTTDDRADSRLGYGADEVAVPQNEVYLVLSEDEQAKGYVRPYRDAYTHATCGGVTTMGRAIAGTYAREPGFYGATYCIRCQMHRPVSEFNWYEMDGSTGPTVGS